MGQGMDFEVEMEKEYEIDFEGHILPVTLELYFEVAYDPDDGADADGNRGRETWGATCKAVTVLDSRGTDLTERLATGHPRQFKVIWDYCESYTVMCDAIEQVEDRHHGPREPEHGDDL
jgi:hypothetical protein